MLHALHKLMGKKIDVVAIETTFTGVLRGVTEDGLILWTSDGWQEIRHDRIKAVRASIKLPPLGSSKKNTGQA